MGKCDCLLGWLCDETITISSFKSDVENISRLQPKLKAIGLLKGEPLPPKQIVDGRKGYLSRFNYYPYCGTKIDWKLIINEL